MSKDSAEIVTIVTTDSRPLLTAGEFLTMVDNTKAGKTDAEIDRDAGLGTGAMSNLRRGTSPALDRAAQLAAAVGLELRVHRNDEPIDPRALHIAIEEVRWLNCGGDLNSIDSDHLANTLAGYYELYERMLSPEATNDPEGSYRRLLEHNRRTRDSRAPLSFRDLLNLTDTPDEARDNG